MISVAVIGQGFVGGSLTTVLSERGLTVYTYDKTDKTGKRVEGGPQSLVECGLLDIPVVSRDIGIADIVLPRSAINDDVTLAKPSVPNVEKLKLPLCYSAFRTLIEEL